MKFKSSQKFDLIFAAPVALSVLLFAFSAVRPQAIEPGASENIAAAGGSFSLEKTVVAGGGGRLAQSSFAQSGTAGQPVAGTRSTGGQFSLAAGFWTPADLVTTAGTAVVGGRIRTADGRGLKNVRVTITFPGGETRAAVSGGFGLYRFAEIPVGQIYTISVAAKKYTFSQPVQVMQILDDTNDIDFTADPLGGGNN